MAYNAGKNTSRTSAIGMPLNAATANSTIAMIGKNAARAKRRGSIDAPAGISGAGGNNARYNDQFECAPGVIERR
jgi:hypothetical protein